MSQFTAVSRVEISRVVEKQMRNWELARAQHRQVSSEKRILDFIALSRCEGSRGREVAEMLARRLSWPLFDRQILQVMAGDDAIRARLYSSMDERDMSWCEETFRAIMQTEFQKNDYFHRLTETVLCLARKGPGVFVGRAADMILPRDRGLRIRIVAPHEMCVQHYAEEHDVTPDEARYEIDRIEQERDAFVRHHFHVEPDDQTRYDLIINEERLSLEQIVGLIAWTLLSRSSGQP